MLEERKQTWVKFRTYLFTNLGSFAGVSILYLAGISRSRKKSCFQAYFIENPIFNNRETPEVLTSLSAMAIYILTIIE